MIDVTEKISPAEDFLIEDTLFKLYEKKTIQR